MCMHLYGRSPMCPVCVCCSRESADQGVTVIVDNRQNYYKNLKYYLRIISVSRPHQATTLLCTLVRALLSGQQNMSIAVLIVLHRVLSLPYLCYRFVSDLIFVRSTDQGQQRNDMCVCKYICWLDSCFDTIAKR